MQAVHPSFKLIRTESVDSLNVTVEEYQHIKTGAQHIHLNSDNTENVFLVALRTVPQDSTGVAHILEHTALCGSERYPVRDPFFMMTRRSLNTFMNALTSSDWTAYPFASVNRKDFHNLLEVYLDAVFFSRLDRLDFAQEGHRLEFAEPENPDSELMYKGVVFNEMKGAMSSVFSILWQTLNKYLHPETTYHFNSGGEPDCIPQLTYEQLRAFYKTHYHPSNAIFMTYGDITAAEHQKYFEELALNRFDALPKQISVPDELRYYAPIKVTEPYPLAEEEDNGEKAHVVISWLLSRSTDLQDALTAQLLSSILLDNSASPLLHALETSPLGNAPSPLCGMDDSQKELTFACGLEGCANDATEAVEQLVLQTLEKVAQDGVPQEDVDAALHQLELHQREVGGDHYPYGLSLILHALTAATHRGDPIAMLNVDKALNQLREAIQQKDFVQSAVRKLFLDNPHRVTLTLLPDHHIASRKDAHEKARLAQIKESLDETQTQKIIADAKALQERQVQQDDASILPQVTLEDVPKTETPVPFAETNLTQNDQPVRTYKVGSNGLVYQQTVIDMPELSRDHLQLLPLYTSCVTDVGVHDKDYLQVQRWQSQVCGSFSAYSNLRSDVNDIHQTNQFITFSSKALVRNHAKLCDLMVQTMDGARFDEHSRISEIIGQIRSSKEQSVTGSGHALAMMAAASGICHAAKLVHEVNGLEGIKRLKALHKSIKENDSAIQDVCAAFSEIHQRITEAPRRHLLIGEDEALDSLLDTYAQYFDANKQQAGQLWSLQRSEEQVRQGWLTNSQVNFCAKAYPTVPLTHPDAAPLSVLANVLRNGFLHRAVREQGGAYGGGAGQDSNNAAFRFFSYRDPRLEETLTDFDQSIEWILATSLPWQTIEEAILGIASNLDKPDSPAGTAKNHFHSDLHGRTLEIRQQYRERVLATTHQDLQRVASTYLTPDKAHVAVITDYSKESQVKDLGLEALKL